MKPLFFFLFVFISFTATAQFPAPGHNGYRKYYVSWQEGLIKVVNKRNKFVEYFVGKDAILYDPGEDVAKDIRDYYFWGHKYFSKERYYYSTFKRGNSYRYVILIHAPAILLYVESKYNDAEFKKCKKMLDKQAAIVIRDDGYDYPHDYPNDW